MVFIRPISRDELRIFLEALIKKQEETGDFIKYFSHLGLNNIFLGTAKLSPGGSRKLPKIAEGMVESIDSDASLAVLSSLFKNILQGDSIEASRMKIIMLNMFKEIAAGRWDLLQLISVKRYDLATFVHSLSVGILAMFFASKLKYKKDDVLELGIAALFHDMGKIAISREVIRKPSVLTDEEMNYVKSHTILGAEILLQYVDSLGVLPALIAFEHHLHYDLKGYPELIYPRKAHPLSLIVTICDCYDALRQRRSYKRAYAPEMIYEIMLRGKGKLFDPKLFDKFFSFLGVYPIGTIVELNDGRIGIVRVQNEFSIFLPQVEIIPVAQDKDTIVDLDKHKTTWIKASLNPLSEGKKYVSFI